MKRHPKAEPFVVAKRRTPREARPRVLDWRFWVALAGLLMVAYLVVGGYQDNVNKGRRIDSLIALTKAKDDRAEAAAARAARAAQAASRERDALLANQRELLRELRRLEDRQDRTLAYLAEQGLPPPTAQDLERFSPQANNPRPPAPGRPGVETTPKEQERPRPTRPTPRPRTNPPPNPGPPEERPPRDPVRDLLDNLLPPILRP